MIYREKKKLNQSYLLCMLGSNKGDNNEMFNEYNKYLIRRLQMKAHVIMSVYQRYTILIKL